MVRLWTATRTFEVAKTVEGTSGEAIASRASLVSRSKSAAREFLNGRLKPQKRERWIEVQRAFSAWWRPHLAINGDGEEKAIILLAMRWELVGQIGIELPGVTDQTSLTTLGTRFGVLERESPVPAILSGGARRLAVLALELTTELLEEPDLDPPVENPDREPDSDPKLSDTVTDDEV
jgi:hypothetical protein